MQKEKILHISEKLSPGSEWSLTEAPSETEGPDLVPTSDNVSSDGKDNNSAVEKQEKKEEESLLQPSEKKGDTLQIAASKPHGGIALYRGILANVLVSEGKVTNSASDKQEKGAESSVQTTDNKGENKGEQTVQTAVEAVSAQVNTAPTPAQAEAGKAESGHVTIGDGFYAVYIRIVHRSRMGTSRATRSSAQRASLHLANSRTLW